MAELIIFLSIFAFSSVIFYRFRERLSLLLIAIAAFIVATIPSNFFENEKESTLILINEIAEEFISRLNFFNVSAFVVLAFSFFYITSTVRLVKEGNSAIVERFGRYHRKLVPGLNLIVPIWDSVVLEDSLREQIFEIPPQVAITMDNVSLTVEALIYWRVYDLERAYYAVEDLEFAMSALVVTTLRSEIGETNFIDVFSSRENYNRAILDVLDEATAPWGAKINRVELQEISVSPIIQDVMEKERAASMNMRASLIQAEGKYKELTLKMESEAKATVSVIHELRQALPEELSAAEILNYLISLKHVEASARLAESNNSKVIYRGTQQESNNILSDYQGASFIPPEVVEDSE